ncbi:MAG TPA: thioredoxin domain-containing protein, partial [Anaeromyxobacter sp.]|nr:thioredoxin domain-containing protein [Anaeromyxobacter sp.]
VWGGFAYLVALVLAASGLRGSRPHETWPAGLLFVLGGSMTAVALVLAALSELAIGALCLLCAGSWVASAILFASAWRATLPRGVSQAVRADAAVLGARPGRTAALALAGVAAVAVLAAAYPRYWERKPATPQAQARAAHPVPATSGGPVVVVEFSDYECPYCALAHEDLKALLAERPDVKLVKKHFPLDPTCNRAVPRAIHKDACALAAAAVCAEEQGKFSAMDDALFRNQKEKRPLDEIVREVGLDVGRFSACFRSPGTQRRIEADVTAGLAVGVKATPTYVVNGVPFTGGKLTAEQLPPPPAGTDAKQDATTAQGGGR